MKYPEDENWKWDIFGPSLAQNSVAEYINVEWELHLKCKILMLIRRGSLIFFFELILLLKMCIAEHKICAKNRSTKCKFQLENLKFWCWSVVNFVCLILWSQCKKWKFDSVLTKPRAYKRETQKQAREIDQ